MSYPPSEPKEDITIKYDPLTLEIDDKVLVRSINDRIRKNRLFYDKEKNLRKRQEKNLDYWMGKQIDEDKLKNIDARYIDNLIYESESTIKPIAMSSIPDLLITPARDFDNSKSQAYNLTKIINSDLRKRDVRRTTAIALKHIPIFFIGAIKIIWNPQKGKDGDYDYVLVHPWNLVLDIVPTNRADDMEYIGEYRDMSVKEVLMRFPESEEKLFNELSGLGIAYEDKKNESKMATKIRVLENWFTWYDKKKDGFERIEGVCWKYKNLILGKMKTPYWDWSGENKVFTYDEAKKEERLLKEEEMRNTLAQTSQNQMGQMQDPAEMQMAQEQNVAAGMPMMDQQQMQQAQPQQIGMNPQEKMIQSFNRTIYHNFFEMPRKPYIFLGYDQMGAMPYDETSRIEQVLKLQDNVNKRGKQITEIADEARVRHVWSAAAGLEKKDVEDFQASEAGSGIIVDGEDVNKVHGFIVGEQPSQSLYEDQEINRARIFEIEGVHSTTRGKKESNTATTSQILRQADNTKIDDFVEDTLNFACEEMARWAMQMIKLRYNKDHFRRILGSDGATTFFTVNRDMIDDGMEVIVSASGVDKIMKKRMAMDLAKIKSIDPLTLFEDLDLPNPKERTLKLMTLSTNPQEYLQKYVFGNMTQGNATPPQPPQPQQPPQGQPQQPQPQQPMPQPQPQVAPQQPVKSDPMQDIQMLVQGQTPPPPLNVDQNYIMMFDRFVKSGQFQQLNPEIQKNIIRFAQVLLAQLKQGGTMQ